MKVFNKVFAVLMAFSVLVLTGTPVLAAESVANATVTGVQYSIEETGSAITFPIVVKLGDKQLKEDTDYTVTYSNNTAVGQASLKISGIGDYEGEQLIAFTITAKEEKATETPAEEETPAEPDDEDTADDVEEEEEKDTSDSKKEKDTEAEAKLDASDDSSKTPAKVDTTETANTDSGSNNSTTKDSHAKVTKPTVKKSPKTGDYNNGLLISFATLSVLLLAGGAYYIHLKRA